MEKRSHKKGAVPVRRGPGRPPKYPRPAAEVNEMQRTMLCSNRSQQFHYSRVLLSSIDVQPFPRPAPHLEGRSSVLNLLSVTLTDNQSPPLVISASRWVPSASFALHSSILAFEGL